MLFRSYLAPMNPNKDCFLGSSCPNPKISTEKWQSTTFFSGSREQVISCLANFMGKFLPPCSVGIKINLSSPPSAVAPKTDPVFLSDILACLIRMGYSVTLVEGANGHLRENLTAIGLERFLCEPTVGLLDTDLEEDVLWKELHGRRYPIPKCLQCLDVRLAVPCATKCHGFVFSCNVKTFVGLLPRSKCVNGTDSTFSRPIIHEDLTETISDLYRIVCETIPFHYYLNGGNTFSEASILRELPEYYCSADPIELDAYIASILHTELPEYLTRLNKINA